jgi:hypothetical protein
MRQATTTAAAASAMRTVLRPVELVAVELVTRRFDRGRCHEPSGTEPEQQNCRAAV